jgi:hypothetical protein
MVASLELPCTIGRDIRDDVCRRRLDVGDDELGGKSRRAAEAVLLPRVDEGPRRVGIGNGGTGRREAETPSRTFAATFDRPHRRRPTERAARGRKHAQPRAAGRAERVGGTATRDAAARKHEIDEPNRQSYVANRNVSVPIS